MVLVTLAERHEPTTQDTLVVPLAYVRDAQAGALNWEELETVELTDPVIVDVRTLCASRNCPELTTQVVTWSSDGELDFLCPLHADFALDAHATARAFMSGDYTS